jgi:hypothetical protein
MADDRAVLGIGGVLLVSEERVGIADAIDEVQQRPQGGVAHVLLGTEPHADHRFGLGDGLVRNFFHFR